MSSRTTRQSTSFRVVFRGTFFAILKVHFVESDFDLDRVHPGPHPSDESSHRPTECESVFDPRSLTISGEIHTLSDRPRLRSMVMTIAFFRSHL